MIAKHSRFAAFGMFVAKAKTIVTICDAVIPTAEPIKKLKVAAK